MFTGIYRNSQIVISDGTSELDENIVLYRGDRLVQIYFEILDNPYKYREDLGHGNIIERLNASYAQLVIRRPNGLAPVYSPVMACENGLAPLVITQDMIDEIEEVGKYDFQIRLFDETVQSRATIPPITAGIDIREPIATEDGAFPITPTPAPPLDVFDDQDEYIKTAWTSASKLTDAELNKIETALYVINQFARKGGGGMTEEQKQQLAAAFAHISTYHFDGNYNNLTNLPDLTIYFTEGKTRDLINELIKDKAEKVHDHNANDITFDDGKSLPEKIDEVIVGATVDLTNYVQKTDFQLATTAEVTGMYTHIRP